MAFAQAARRPIVGAVATLGVSDRVAFLRRTYALLGGALIAFALMSAGLMVYAPQVSLGFSKLIFSMGFLGAVVYMIAYVGIVSFAQRLAFSETSRGVQLFGLVLGVFVQAMVLQPLLWFLAVKYGHPGPYGFTGTLNGDALAVIGQAVIITLTIFIGLTLTVFITKKDFTFLRGALAIGVAGFIGLALASWAFGFHTGGLLTMLGILLMSGYILHQTSLVLGYFPPTGYVGAALMLFTTIAQLFRFVLQLLASSNRR